MLVLGAKFQSDARVLANLEHPATLIAVNYSDPLDFDTWLCLSFLPPFSTLSSPSLAVPVVSSRHPPPLLDKYSKYQHSMLFLLRSRLNTHSDDPPNTIQQCGQTPLLLNKHSWCLFPWLLDVYSDSIIFFLALYFFFSVFPLLYKPRKFYNEK
jgi:hypothetical protein